MESFFNWNVPNLIISGFYDLIEKKAEKSYTVIANYHGTLEFVVH